MPDYRRMSQAERERRAYWAQRRNQQRAAGQQRQSTDPNHPHNHRCTERTIDYGDTEHQCTVCGRTWTLETIPLGPISSGATTRRYRATPVTQKIPPLRHEHEGAA